MLPSTRLKQSRKEKVGGRNPLNSGKLKVSTVSTSLHPALLVLDEILKLILCWRGHCDPLAPPLDLMALGTQTTTVKCNDIMLLTYNCHAPHQHLITLMGA